MRRTRRGLLGAGAGLAAGLAGCLGAEGVAYPDAEPPSDTSALSADDGDESGDADADALAEDAEAHNSELAEATRAVFDDLRWFAHDYKAAVREYREAVAAVVTEVESVRETVLETGEPTAEQVDGIETVGNEALETAGEVFVPHFDPRSRIRYLVNDHVTVLERFAARDDADRFIEELDRTRSSFAGIGTGRYAAARFSREPIHNRLLDRLVPGASDSRLVTLDFDGEVLETVAYEPSAEDDGEEAVSLRGDGVDDAVRNPFLARLGPVVQPDDREETLLVDVAVRPDRDVGFEGWPRELGGTPLFVQRYSDAETAAARLDDATAAAATEDREPIGADEDVRWHRLYHHEAAGERYEFDRHGAVQYGYVVRAGEFLLATGFSGDAWEERTGWRGPLSDAWALQ